MLPAGRRVGLAGLFCGVFMAVEELSFAFADGVLKIGDVSAEMRIEWGENPIARRRWRRPNARWREFWPDFRLLSPGTPESATTSAKTAAFTGFRELIPAEFVQIAEGFQSHQWIMLKSLHQSDIFLDLARSNRVLAYCLANNAEFRSKEDDIGARLAVPHSHRKRREILEWLGFPPRESVVKLLGRLDPQVATLSTLRYLKSALHRNHMIGQALAHQPILNCGVISLLCSPGTKELVSSALLKEVAASEDEVMNSPTLERLERAMELLRCMRVRRDIRPLQSIAAVNSFHDDVSEEYPVFLEQRRMRHKKNKERPKHLFPDPPVPGTDTIVPITSLYAIRRESQEQRNCVRHYAPQVTNGNVYIYRVLAPERATLAIAPAPDGSWHRYELALKANRRVSQETAAHVDHWLYQYSLSA
jgi:hypothetical protein